MEYKKNDYGMDKSHAKSNNEQYLSKGMGGKVMGHASSPSSCYFPVGQGWKEIKPFKPGNLGYPTKAFDYKY